MGRIPFVIFILQVAPSGAIVVAQFCFLQTAYPHGANANRLNSIKKFKFPEEGVIL